MIMELQSAPVLALLGVMLLVAGRKLYWLLSAVVGLVAGLYISAVYFHTTASWQQAVVAVVAGLVGALLAVSLQKVAAVVVGFFAGGYGLVVLAQSIGIQVGTVSLGQVNSSPLGTVIFIVGGIIGTALMAALFDWALIGITSWFGATLITRMLDLRSGLSAIVFLALLCVGIIIQLAANRMEKRQKAEAEDKAEPEEKA